MIKSGYWTIADDVQSATTTIVDRDGINFDVKLDHHLGDGWEDCADLWRFHIGGGYLDGILDASANIEKAIEKANRVINVLELVLRKTPTSDE